LNIRKNIITVAIDSPAAAGAGTQAKLISQYYNLMYLDTGKIYRLIGKLILKSEKKLSYKIIKKKIDKIKIKDLKSKSLLDDDVAVSASKIAKNKKIRQFVKNFQKKCAYDPPLKYAGSVLDGRDITSVIMRQAMFKFYITANIKVRAERRFRELRKLKKKITLLDVEKSLKKRDYLDKNREHSPLKKTKDSILINTSKLSKKASFKKIKTIMDKKLKKINGSIQRS
jgi:cytidylate kinase